jgi:hypothetical protein
MHAHLTEFHVDKFNKMWIEMCALCNIPGPVCSLIPALHQHTYIIITSAWLTCTENENHYQITFYIFRVTTRASQLMPDSVHHSANNFPIINYSGWKNQLPGVCCHDEKQQPWDRSESAAHVLIVFYSYYLNMLKHLLGPHYLPRKLLRDMLLRCYHPSSFDLECISSTIWFVHQECVIIYAYYILIIYIRTGMV